MKFILFLLFVTLLFWGFLRYSRSDRKKFAELPLRERVGKVALHFSVNLVCAVVVAAIVVFALSKELAALKYLFF